LGKRGPKKKPDELDRLDGRPGKRGKSANAPAASGAPSCPAHLDSYAKAVWQRIVTAMPPDLYTNADRELLAAYCDAASEHKRAVEAIREQGHVLIGGNGGAYQNPWVGIRNKQAQMMASLGTRLGLDPAARTSIQMPSKDDGSASKFGGLVAIEGGRNGS